VDGEPLNVRKGRKKERKGSWGKSKRGRRPAILYVSTFSMGGNDGPGEECAGVEREVRSDVRDERGSVGSSSDCAFLFQRL